VPARCGLWSDDVAGAPIASVRRWDREPEQLKYDAQGAWSRRITDVHRLVSFVDGGDVIILQARYHY